MIVEDNGAHNLSQMSFLIKFLIPDCRGSSVKKWHFWPFLQNSFKDPTNSLRNCIGQWGATFALDGLPSKILNPRFLGIKFQKIVFLPFLQNGIKDIPSFVAGF